MDSMSPHILYQIIRELNAAEREKRPVNASLIREAADLGIVYILESEAKAVSWDEFMAQPVACVGCGNQHPRKEGHLCDPCAHYEPPDGDESEDEAA